MNEITLFLNDGGEDGDAPSNGARGTGQGTAHNGHDSPAAHARKGFDRTYKNGKVVKVGPTIVNAEKMLQLNQTLGEKVKSQDRELSALKKEKATHAQAFAAMQRKLERVLSVLRDNSREKQEEWLACYDKAAMPETGTVDVDSRQLRGLQGGSESNEEDKEEEEKLEEDEVTQHGQEEQVHEAREDLDGFRSSEDAITFATSDEEDDDEDGQQAEAKEEEEKLEEDEVTRHEQEEQVHEAEDDLEGFWSSEDAVTFATSLRAYLEKSSPHTTILAMLTRVEARPMTKSVLLESGGLGKVVRSLRKHANPAVVKLARQLAAKWKAMVKAADNSGI